MMNFTDEQANLMIQVPISTTDRAQAEAFARQQPTPEKAEQVYHSTLAVLAFNTYLHWQHYKTNLQAGDSWSPTNQLCGDVADLMIVGLGKVECRPVFNLDSPFLLPPEVWHNRIGYIAVQLSQDGTEATLLGFAYPLDPEDPPEELPLSDLQSMDDLLDYFERLELGQQVLNDSSAEAEQVQQIWADPFARLMLVAQLERIYRSESRRKWRVKGEKVLSGRVLIGATVREEAIPADRIQLQDVAERLLERLATVWQQMEESANG